jgi:hypothetical protein
MKCAGCDNESPVNVLSFNKAAAWICPMCDVQTHIFDHVHSMPLGNYLYVSEFTNNLDKLAMYYSEHINTPMTITLSLPEGLLDLHGPYSGIYVDEKSLSLTEAEKIPRTSDAFIKLVHPTTQRIL